MKRHRPACPRRDKTAHRTLDDARVGAREFARELNRRGEHADAQYAYLCVCGRWHLTRRPRWGATVNTLAAAAAPDALQEWAIHG